MPLAVGELAPDFDLPAHDGRQVRLSELRGKKNVVLYFYPKDFTPVCTKETCGFRDHLPRLAEGDAEVVGVSPDTLETHRRFARQYEVPFALLSDPDRELARRYGAAGGLRGLLGQVQRVTYVIDKQGRIAGVVQAELSASKHTAGVQEILRGLPVAP